MKNEIMYLFRDGYSVDYRVLNLSSEEIKDKDKIRKYFGNDLDPQLEIFECKKIYSVVKDLKDE